MTDATPDTPSDRPARCPKCETPGPDATPAQIQAWASRRGHIASGAWSAIQRGRGGCGHIPPAPPLPRQYTVFPDRGARRRPDAAS